jgi:hypothetical protein
MRGRLVTCLPLPEDRRDRWQQAAISRGPPRGVPEVTTGLAPAVCLRRGLFLRRSRLRRPDTAFGCRGGSPTRTRCWSSVDPCDQLTGRLSMRRNADAPPNGLCVMRILMECEPG